MNRYLLMFLLLGHSLQSVASDFALGSPAFPANSMIPAPFTCNGSDKSPPLFWRGAPAKTQSFALVVDDPDAPSGSWTHWLVFNIPASTNKIDINSLPEGALVALNSWGKAQYQGPCPPLGAHRYLFSLYALDKKLNLNNGAPTKTVLDEMTGHVLDTAILSGLYQKE